MKAGLVLFTGLIICICTPGDSSSPLNEYSQNSYDDNSIKHSETLLPCVERYVAEPYFREYDSLMDSNFQEFVINKFPVGSDKASPKLLMLKRFLIGEGSHRRLSSSVQFSIPPELMPAFSSQLCEVIIIERLPSGVFADPFELEHLLYRGVYKDASVFGDANLELPSFRSNRSVIEVHLDATVNESAQQETFHEFKMEIPLHARYSPLEDSGYSKVRFDAPDLFVRCKMPGELPVQTCLLTPITVNVSLKHDNVVWIIPAGMKAHAGTVSVVTFASALFSAVWIIFTSLKHLHFEADGRLKQS